MIIIPMAGLSSRFKKEGYSLPKYMLKAHGKTLFEHSVLSFKEYFDDEFFLFVARDISNTEEFIRAKCQQLRIKNFKIFILSHETRGQAETVFLPFKQQKSIEDVPITIFNIDTFRPGFKYQTNLLNYDGFLEVFEGQGDNWSFVKTKNKNSTEVAETAEKNRISNLCCTGLYHFKSLTDYVESYLNFLEMPKEEWQKGELYVAPLYNYLIKNGKEIHFNLIKREEVIFCGVPAEYDSFLKSSFSNE